MISTASSVPQAPFARVRAGVRRPRTNEARERFRKDVIEGFSLSEKRISSKYFYDAQGDELFRQIMASPDYYLTRAEAEIFRTHNSAITRALSNDREQFDVIEFGAGDGSKTSRLLRKWISRGQVPTYIPVDISRNTLNVLHAGMEQEIPGLNIVPQQGEYFHVLEERIGEAHGPQVLLFLGSNIGNLDRVEAVHLLRQFCACMNEQDRLLVGFDLKKDPRIIRRAYDDRAGITRQFNLNLLHRINHELGADIRMDLFMHEAVYDPFEAKAMSFLVSKQEQQITIPGAATPFTLKAWEAIHTENSHKYDPEMIAALAHDAGLSVSATFMDKRQYFADVVFARM